MKKDGKVDWDIMYAVSPDGEVLEYNRITGKERIFYDPTAYNHKPGWEPNPQPMPPEMKAFLKWHYGDRMEIYDPADYQQEKKEELEEKLNQVQAYEQYLVEHPDDEIVIMEFLEFLTKNNLEGWISEPVKKILLKKYEEVKNRVEEGEKILKELEEHGFIKVKNEEKEENK